MNDLNFKFGAVPVRRLASTLLLAFLLVFLLLSPKQKPESSNTALKKVKVYFGNSELNIGEHYDCTEVFPVTRWVDSTAYPPMAALRELLKGPTKREKKEGYHTSINYGVGIKGLWIEDGLAKVDFTGRIAEGGGSCWVGGNVSQIRATLKQFDYIDEVKLFAGGRLRGIQP